MGEAKRRKKLDPNYGYDDFQLKFLSKKESEVMVRKSLKYFAAKQDSKYYFVQLITKELTIIGLGLPFVIGKEINVKCLWQTSNNMSVEFQNKIINRHLKKITKQIGLKAKSELDRGQIYLGRMDEQ